MMGLIYVKINKIEQISNKKNRFIQYRLMSIDTARLSLNSFAIKNSFVQQQKKSKIYVFLSRDLQRKRQMEQEKDFFF